MTLLVTMCRLVGSDHGSNQPAEVHDQGRAWQEHEGGDAQAFPAHDAAFHDQQPGAGRGSGRACRGHILHERCQAAAAGTPAAANQMVSVAEYLQSAFILHKLIGCLCDEKTG